MNIDRFRDPAIALKLVTSLQTMATRVPALRIMEVCGTHTMEIGRLGIRQLLPANIELLSGPGCPVCVTPASYIDALCDCATAGRARIATFGDLFRVPGTTTSLARVKAQGAAVDIVTSPLVALDMARNNREQEIIFTAVGFETTVPATAAAIQSAAEQKLTNLTFLCAHRLVPPALNALISDPTLGINAFLLPGHVSAIIGETAYASIAERGIPGVITGFEPLDILAGILALVEMAARHECALRNEYTRVVRREGNPAALALVNTCYEPCDAVWRGIGTIPASGLCLKKPHAAFDAAKRFGIKIDNKEMPSGCSCGDVLKGRCKPDACPLFGTSCTPDHPVGPCMVSSEGSCAAYFRYGG
ncbi:MAG: hydrogenase formation protein HypD [Chitinispirillaceae bacterium]|nr:hydrogenase formation protein HypD [Chitinispirillaceae bacterium]